MILAAAPLKPGASLQDVKTALAGNLCRCTGYPAIFRSVDAALNPSWLADFRRSAKREVELGERRREGETCPRALMDSRSSGRARSRRRCRCWPAIRKLTPIAGCTDVYVGLHFGTVKEQRFIDLWNLDELRGIGLDGGRLRIGALTTYSEIIASKLVTRRLPMLVAAAREVGGAQIQNRGTLGGNIANASPAGDTLAGPRWRPAPR